MTKSRNLSVYPQARLTTVSSRRKTRFNSVVPAVALAMFLLAPLGAFAQSAENSTAPRGLETPLDLSAYVSPGLDRAEQDLLRATLNSMPLSMQHDLAAKPADSVHIAIVEGGTGLIHYNRPEDQGSYDLQPNTGMPGDENPFTANAGLDPGVFGGSGPYRRVYTKPMPELAQPAPEVDDVEHQRVYVSDGDVSISCGAGSFPSSEDVGYSYIGGWSGSWNTLSGVNSEASAVDAGLQYSPTNNNYALILALSKAGIITHSNFKGAVLPPRIQCTNKNDWAEMRFWAYGAWQLQSVAPSCWQVEYSLHKNVFIGFPEPDCNTYALVLSVSSDQFVGHIGSIMTYMLVWFSPNYLYGGWGQLEPYTAAEYNGHRNVKGWLPRVPCENCAFKWMTSIAQKKENLTDNSWYAAAWAGHFLGVFEVTGKLAQVPAVDLYCTEYPLWESAYPSKHAQDCRNTPSGLKGVPQSVSVSQYTSQRETDLIDLKY